MTSVPFDVGAYVLGTPTSPRALVRHSDLLAAYADGVMAEQDETREAYLSHFVFGNEMRSHFAANRKSVKGFAGPCGCRWLVLDIDRGDLAAALSDARRLVTFLHQRYPEMEGEVPVFFSRGRGFHVLVELAHNPPPAVGFQHVARTLAEAIAAKAGVRIDTGVYDVNHLIRLPNTRHPKTGLFKRRFDTEALFRLDIGGIREAAMYPSGDSLRGVRGPVTQLATDWHEAEVVTARGACAGTAARGACADTPDERAPRYLVDFIRFGVDEGERHRTLFRCAAWLTEQGAPPSLCSALLTESGCDVGLGPKDVERQIRCGIDHARRQRGASADPQPDPTTDDFERHAIEHEGDPLSPDALEFPFGTLAPVASEVGTQ